MSRTNSTIWLTALVFATLTSLAACTTTAPPAPPAGVTPAPVTPAPVTPAPVIAPPVPATAAGDLVVLRVGADPQTRRLQMVDASTGQIQADLPDGVIDRHAGLVYVATAEGPVTRISALDLRTGWQVRSTTVDGTLTLPSIGVDAVPVGLSGDGRSLILAVQPGLLGKGGESPMVGDLRSRFAVLGTDLTASARMIDLAGRFSFDALSPDGQVLYLVEHVPADSPTGYQVRAYDVALGALRDGVIVDKTAGALLMQGTPVTQLRSATGGWIYTLYRNRANGPFIHALNAADGWALCLFPTRRPNAADEERAAAGWDLVLSPDGSQLYAANGALGMVTQVDTVELGQTRTVQLAGTGSAASGDARGAAVSADGKTLFVAVGDEIVELKAASLGVSGRRAGAADIAAIAVRPQGDLYATSRTGELSVIGLSGVGATVPLGGGPARILWVEAQR